MQEPILVLDSGSALAGLIARILRLQQVYAKSLPVGTPIEDILALAPRGIILATEQKEGSGVALPDLRLLDAGIPTLALGDTTVALCIHFGGEKTEQLPASQSITLGLMDSPLFTDITGGERMLHRLSCLSLPETLVPLATATERCIGFSHRELPLYAMEYPIEHNDPDAAQLLFNFATLICGAGANWDEHAIIQQALDDIRQAAGEGGMLCAVSGGVDSAVCAKLAHMALEDKLQCVFVDTGLLREGEANEVITSFQEAMGLTVAYVDASEAFLNAMSHVHSPEDKKRITTSLLQQVLRKQLAGDPQLQTLAMGTNFNDTLYGPVATPTQSGGKEEVDYRVIEPIRELFKEEVRRLGVALSLPASIVDRQSFPASGLALRIIGEVTSQRLELLRAADAFFQEEIRKGGHEKRLWQYYATLLEDPGAPGTYAVVLRALQTAQGHAYAARLPYDVLERVTERIRCEVPGVDRVTYDLTPSMHYEEQE